MVENHRKLCKNLVKTVENVQKIYQKSRKNVDNDLKFKKKIVQNHRKLDK